MARGHYGRCSRRPIPTRASRNAVAHRHRGIVHGALRCRAARSAGLGRQRRAARRRARASGADAGPAAIGDQRRAPVSTKSTCFERHSPQTRRACSRAPPFPPRSEPPSLPGWARPSSCSACTRRQGGSGRQLQRQASSAVPCRISSRPVEQLGPAFLLRIIPILDLQPLRARAVGIGEALRDDAFEVVRAHQLVELATPAGDRQRL